MPSPTTTETAIKAVVIHINRTTIQLQPFNYNHSTTTIQLQPFFYSVIYTGINQNKIIIEKIIRKNVIFYYYFLLEKMIIEKLLDTNNLCINLHSHIFENCCGLSFSMLWPFILCKRLLLNFEQFGQTSSTRSQLLV